MARPRKPPVRFGQEQPRSSSDLVEEGKDLLRGAQPMRDVLDIDEEGETASFTSRVGEKELERASSIAKGYKDWGEKHRNSAASFEAEELRNLAFYINKAVENQRRLEERVPLREQKASTVGSRAEPAPKGKVKKGAKLPKVKKVKVPKKPTLTPEQEARAARARERREMYRERRDLRRQALEEKALPFDIRNSQARYNRDYLVSNKDGDSAVARVVRDKVTGQFKSVPGALIAYKRGGVVGKIFK